jgi:hypothetical protein
MNTNEAPVICADCGAQVHRLEIFPKGRCLECHANSPEGRRIVTAGELARMWGGR